MSDYKRTLEEIADIASRADLDDIDDVVHTFYWMWYLAGESLHGSFEDERRQAEEPRKPPSNPLTPEKKQILTDAIESVDREYAAFTERGKALYEISKKKAEFWSKSAESDDHTLDSLQDEQGDDCENPYAQPITLTNEALQRIIDAKPQKIEPVEGVRYVSGPEEARRIIEHWKANQSENK